MKFRARIAVQGVGLVASISGLPACEVEAQADADATSATADTGSDTAASGCPGETPMAFDVAVQGSTATAGWAADLTSWYKLSEVACDPFGTDYPPPFQVYALAIPAKSDWDVVVTPDAGVDVSLVTWMQGGNDYTCAPTRGIGVVTCDVSNIAQAGAEERVRLHATTNPYRVLILVATPPGGQKGGFTLRAMAHLP